MGARGRREPNGRVMIGGYYRIAMAEGIKVLLPSKGKNNNLPEMSHTSRVYATIYQSGEKAGMIKQLRIYGVDHYPVADIDFGHQAHHGLRGGDIHVHVFLVMQEGILFVQRKAECLMHLRKGNLLKYSPIKKGVIYERL